jgi:zinc transport system substrate-binding protein
MGVIFKMKRLGTVILALLLLVTALSGCTQTDSPQQGKISVVCTILSQYDWVRQILGDKADEMELSLLLNSGADLHSFQPSADDIIKIADSDLFIYVGGESDAWVEDALNEATNPDMVVLNLLDTLGAGAKTEEIIEGMEDDEAHEHEDEHEGESEHEGEEEHAHEEGEVFDEHVWLSLKNAQVFCSDIADALSSLDAGNAEVYQNNLTAYNEKLSALDAEYQAVADAGAVKTLLFGDRFPFRYLVDDYDLAYYAAFPGCSAETEASFETIVFLANKADELGLTTVMALEGSDQSIANTIISNTAAEKYQQILVLDSLQSVTEDDMRNGATYLSVMESNLNVLKAALQ